MPDTRRLSPAPDDLRRAAAMLRAGGLVAMPTETVYGLAADATKTSTWADPGSTR